MPLACMTSKQGRIQAVGSRGQVSVNPECISAEIIASQSEDCNIASQLGEKLLIASMTAGKVGTAPAVKDALMHH